MGGWAELLFAALVFLVSHMLPTRPGLREALTAGIGRRRYLVAYSLTSIASFSWLIAAAGRAPFISLWSWSPERVWLANILMAVALGLAVSGAGIANPFSLGGLKSRRFDPARPGIVAVTRHPLLWAILIWSVAHVIANGDLAHVLLFGGAGLVSILGLGALEARSRRTLGAAFQTLSQGSSFLPFAALIAGRARWRGLLDWRIGAVPVVWAAVNWLHIQLLKVSPLPPP